MSEPQAGTVFVCNSVISSTSLTALGEPCGHLRTRESFLRARGYGVATPGGQGLGESRLGTGSVSPEAEPQDHGDLFMMPVLG